MAERSHLNDNIYWRPANRALDAIFFSDRLAFALSIHYNIIVDICFIGVM